MNLQKLLTLLRRNPDVLARFSVNMKVATPVSIVPIGIDLRSYGIEDMPYYVPYMVKLSASTVSEMAREFFARGLITKEEYMEYANAKLFRLKGLVRRLINDPDAPYYAPVIIIGKTGNNAWLNVLLVTTSISKPIVINNARMTL